MGRKQPLVAGMHYAAVIPLETQTYSWQTNLPHIPPGTGLTELPQLAHAKLPTSLRALTFAVIQNLRMNICWSSLTNGKVTHKPKPNREENTKFQTPSQKKSAYQNSHNCIGSRNL